MQETELSRAIRRELERLGFMVERIQSGQHRVTGGYVHCASKGTPDLHLVGLGWLEVKRPGETVSEDQARWHARARRAGARVAVVDHVFQAVEIALMWKRENELDGAA